MTLIQFDRRATHRIFSEPVALDTINDVQALAQEIETADLAVALKCLVAANWLAIKTGDAELVRGINLAHDRVFRAIGRTQAIRDRANAAAGLVEESLVIDPYRALEVAA